MPRWACWREARLGGHASGQELPRPTTSTRYAPDPNFIESSAVTRASGPASITRAVFQDRTVRLWLATWEGLISYDQETFTNHTNLEDLFRYRAFAILRE